MRAARPIASRDPESTGAAPRAAVVRALAMGRNDRAGAERAVARALAGLDEPVDLAAEALRLAWAAPWPRRRRPVFEAGRGSLDGALSALSPETRMALVLDVWLGWDTARSAAVLDLTATDVAEHLRAALDRLGAEPSARRDDLRAHLAERASEVPVGGEGWDAAQAHARRRQRRVPLLLALAGGGLLVAVAMLGGGSGAPTPTVVRPAPARPLAASAAAEPAVLAEPGPSLSFAPVELPAGVALPWVRTLRDGFVALEADMQGFLAPTGRVQGVWTSTDGERWQRLDADLASFDEADFVQGVATGPQGIVAAGGTVPEAGYAARWEPLVWESADGVEWRRIELPGPHRPAPEHLIWRSSVQGVAVTPAREVVVGLAVLGIDYLGLLGDRAPDRLPPGFHFWDTAGTLVLAGPGGATIEEYELPDLDLAQLRARQVAVPLTWVREPGGAWEVVETGELLRDVYFQGVSAAGGRFWATAFELETNSEVLLASEDGRDWDRQPIPGGGRRVGAVVDHGHGLSAGAFGLVVLASDDGEEWARLRLPVTATSAAPEGLAGGPFGVVAFGTMGSSGGQVVAPMVTIPGEPEPAVYTLDAATFQVTLPDGTTRELASHERAVRVDFEAETFDLVDPEGGDVLFTGSLAEWNDAIEGAYRAPFPPSGPVAMWYSPDGRRWSLQGPDEGLEAVGFPASVAVGADEVVLAAISSDGVPRLWVGR